MAAPPRTNSPRCCRGMEQQLVIIFSPPSTWSENQMHIPRCSFHGCRDPPSPHRVDALSRGSASGSSGGRLSGPPHPTVGCTHTYRCTHTCCAQEASAEARFLGKWNKHRQGSQTEAVHQGTCALPCGSHPPQAAACWKEKGPGQPCWDVS